MFGLVYLNYNDNATRFKVWRHYLPKDIIKDYNVIINGKKIYPTNWYEKMQEIRKSTTGQNED